jgi:LPS-assembly protein
MTRPLTWTLRQSVFSGLSVIVTGFTILSPAYAQSKDQSQDERWDYCSTQFVPSHLLTPVPQPAKPSDSDRLEVTADSVRVEDQDTYYFEGDVLLRQGDKLLHTDDATYQQSTGKVHAEGLVRYQTAEQLVVGKKADVYVKEDRAKLSDVEFWLLGNHLRGSASTFSVLSTNVMNLDQVKFTSCDKDHESWALRASRLELDFAENEGIAHHARVEFMGVPFVYIPYLSLPLVGRKTGFLAPSFGSSDVSGTDISIPYYLNIAPNRDATLTPRYLGKRGMQYIGEYRYLHRSNNGKMDLEYLPNDEEYHADRTYAAYYHHGNPAPGWLMDVQYRYASDEDYFDDFANNLSAASLTHLERYITLNYQAQNWRANARLQHFQTLDTSIAAVNRPYERLPQLQIVTNPYFLSYGFETSASAEVVNFYRKEGVTGSRLDLAPQIAWRYRTAPGFLESAVTLHHTQYELEHQDPATDPKPSRNLSQITLDSGLFFERDATSNDHHLLQTLEPRLFYLYVPYREQDNLIVDDNGNPQVFDTTLPQFSFSELFRDNRFSGVDRIGDANQMSASLTSRFINDAGNELLSASIGQIYYFQDRKVTLPNQLPQTAGQSDIAAELRSQWNENLNVKASLLWDSERDDVRRGSTEFRYKFGRDKITYLSYRYERDNIDQVDFSFLWQVRPQWKLVGRYYYSFQDELKLESLGGIEYESCCWSLRVVQRDYISDLKDQTTSKSIWVQLELKGLASVGRTVQSAFESGRF